MLDIKLIRNNLSDVQQKLNSRNIQLDLEILIQWDDARRKLLTSTEGLRAYLNKASKEIGTKIKQGGNPELLKAELKEVSDNISQNEQQLKIYEKQIEELLLKLPNLPTDTVPIGKSSEDNVVVKNWGTIPQFSFSPLSHLELGKRLGLFDFERGAKISGSGFPVYTGLGAKLERALWNFFLDRHIANGYKEIIPPVLVNQESVRGTGQWPNLAEDMYLCESEGLYLIPTSEVPIANLFRDEMLDGKKLPMKFCGYSPCFRKEAGSYGKDTRGFLRVHQFNKVEMIWFTKREDSYQDLETMTSHAEELLMALEIPFRRVLLCTGDLGFASSKTYDLEVWSPYENKWLEASSCSNTEDFQARRMNTKYRMEKGDKPEFVHILNGSGLATSRVMVALLENHQTDEGSVSIPPVLRPYMQNRAVLTVNEK
ncbi:MAG: serine--tRNA ligase [bacterium]|nr:serine--tRNA ligase [bacterium]